MRVSTKRRRRPSDQTAPDRTASVRRPRIRSPAARRSSPGRRLRVAAQEIRPDWRKSQERRLGASADFRYASHRTAQTRTFSSQSWPPTRARDLRGRENSVSSAMGPPREGPSRASEGGEDSRGRSALARASRVFPPPGPAGPGAVPWSCVRGEPRAPEHPVGEEVVDARVLVGSPSARVLDDAEGIRGPHERSGGPPVDGDGALRPGPPVGPRETPAPEDREEVAVVRRVPDLLGGEEAERSDRLLEGPGSPGAEVPVDDGGEQRVAVPADELPSPLEAREVGLPDLRVLLEGEKAVEAEEGHVVVVEVPDPEDPEESRADATRPAVPDEVGVPPGVAVLPRRLRGGLRGEEDDPRVHAVGEDPEDAARQVPVRRAAPLLPDLEVVAEDVVGDRSERRRDHPPQLPVRGAREGRRQAEQDHRVLVPARVAPEGESLERGSAPLVAIVERRALEGAPRDVSRLAGHALEEEERVRRATGGGEDVLPSLRAMAPGLGGEEAAGPRRLVREAAVPDARERRAQLAGLHGTVVEEEALGREVVALEVALPDPRLLRERGEGDLRR